MWFSPPTRLEHGVIRAQQTLPEPEVLAIAANVNNSCVDAFEKVHFTRLENGRTVAISAEESASTKTAASDGLVGTPEEM